MIEVKELKSENLSQILNETEEMFVNELENMLLSKLIEEKSIRIQGQHEEVLEFAGRTNHKIRLRVPNKNVWSVSFRDLGDTIRKVLRTGSIFSDEFVNGNSKYGDQVFDHHTNLLLHILPQKEYEKRSLVGNEVVHSSLGHGKVIRISETGNVVVKFEDRTVRLKPNFIKLRTSEA